MASSRRSTTYAETSSAMRGTSAGRAARSPTVPARDGRAPCVGRGAGSAAASRPRRSRRAPRPSVAAAPTGAGASGRRFSVPSKVNCARSPSPSASTRTISPARELAEQDLLGQLVLDVALDRATQRTGTEHRVVALASASRSLAAGVSSMPMSLSRSRLSSLAIIRSTISMISSWRELREHDDVVDAVEELGPEVLLELVVDLGLHPLVASRQVAAGLEAGLRRPWRCPGCRGSWS